MRVGGEGGVKGDSRQTDSEEMRVGRRGRCEREIDRQTVKR